MLSFQERVRKKWKVQHSWLIFVFVLALSIRLFLAFQTPNLELGDAYFTLRQVESIKNTGLPVFNDDLSYSGRFQVFHPLYYYVLTIFSFLFGSVATLKIIPNLFACLFIIISYLIVFQTTNNRNAALIAGIAGAFVPAFFMGTIISASVISFVLPLVFYCLYCFMRISEKKFLYRFLVFSFLLALSTSISFLFIFSLLIYLLFHKLEFNKRNRVETESILFITFLTLWINILIYKRAFLYHSYELVWQNLPSQILDSYFKQVDIIATVTGIGLFTLLFGMFAVYKYMFTERDKRTYLLVSFAVASGIVLWFKLIPLNIGMILLGGVLVPLFGQSINSSLKYFAKTRVDKFRFVLIGVFIVLLVFTAMLPSIAKASESINSAVNENDIDAMEWINKNTDKESVILSVLEEGFLITSVAQRANIVDENFLLIYNPDQILDDIEKVYTSFFKSNVIELTSLYSVDYIYFSSRAKEKYNIEELKYIEEDCFNLVYDKDIKIYQVLCNMNNVNIDLRNINRDDN